MENSYFECIDSMTINDLKVYERIKLNESYSCKLDRVKNIELNIYPQSNLRISASIQVFDATDRVHLLLSSKGKLVVVPQN